MEAVAANGMTSLTPPLMSWARPDVLPREECVLRYVLHRRAEETPNGIYAEFEDGTRWTFAETLEHTRAAATGLARLGLKRGDVLFVFLPNGPEFLKFWFGANYLGASIAAPNIAYRGAVLQHLITLSAATIAVVHHNLMSRLADLDLGEMRLILQTGGASSSAMPGTEIRAAEAALAKRVDPGLLDVGTIEPWDTQFILFTSGTTGPSKGVIVTYVQMQAICAVGAEGRFGPGDRLLLNMPLFHISGTMPAYNGLLWGCTILMIGAFKTDTFWDVVHRAKPTFALMMGSAAAFIANLPPRADDCENTLRVVAMVPLVNDPAAFAKRFGVDIYANYGMSELSVPIGTGPNPTRHESCGKLRAGYEARLVDDNDIEVPEGEPGELILRAARPWAISPGYWRDPIATAAVWRNGWFHTGDSMRRDVDGNYYFVDRKKDAIRRRGENISSFEIELEVLSHPAIAEAAAIAVPSPHGEDDVMVVVVTRPDAMVPPEKLFEHLRPRMAHFALPRYIRFRDELPRTPSLRVQKHVLRAEGITDDSWDREAAGVIIKREVI